jgi:hypothetical protein
VVIQHAEAANDQLILNGLAATTSSTPAASRPIR